MARSTGNKGDLKKLPVRVLLVDSDPLLREQLAHIVTGENGLVVCGHAEDRAKAVQLAEAHKPGLVITDLWLKKSHGLELIKDLQARLPTALILVVSTHDSWFYAARAIRAGARGYVTKRATAETIVQAIRCVLQGKVYLTDTFAQKMNATLTNPSAREPHANGPDNLTDRELEVFELIGFGLDSRQIAEQMRLDISTVDTYRAHIRTKLRVQDSSELLRQAITWVHGSPSANGTREPRQ
jgi:DNA-binding NarL/FixJ family response regulator